MFATAIFATVAFQKAFIPVLIATLAWIGISLFALLRSKKPAADRVPRHWISRLAYAVFLASTLILASTSFGSVLTSGQMQHFALIAHMSAAGAFTFALLAVAIFYLPLTARSVSTWWMERWSALLLVTLGLLTSASMFIGMLPVLDTEGLLVATDVHRFTGLATVSLAVIHLFSLSVRRFGLR
jgi:hypothetical protein